MNSALHPIDAALQRLAMRLERTRLERNWTQARLAREAGVSKRTVERLEHGQSTQLASFLRVLFALGLDTRLDLLVPAPQTSPIELLELEGRRRQRASSERARRPAADRGDEWSWDDEDSR